ncbi:C-type lectin domain family 10 member A-like [Pelmatolapia mariae]|uniref:C-type lectin domain family 10 member A-like n=1 Tax=Pelmatolapia mariae TaxID=158779 RepID=UPI002FE65698
MEDIYVNVDHVKPNNPIPSTKCRDPRSCKRSFHSGVLLSLTLLSVSLVVALIILGVYYLDTLRDSAANLSEMSNKLASMTEDRDLLHANLTENARELERLQNLTRPNQDTLRDSAANLSEMSNKLASMTEDRDLLHANLTENARELERLQNLTRLNHNTLRDSAANLSEMSNKLASMTEERDLLQADLTEKTKEFERLQSWFNQKKTCPVGWSNFSHSCYLLSKSSASWDAARKDCRNRGADLVVIDCGKEQTFLSAITNEHTWIGLNDKEQEGTWKWVDGTPVIFTYWSEHQPDDGGGKEDCAHFRNDEKKSWNDIPCSTSLKWICEKAPNNFMVF